MKFYKQVKGAHRSRSLQSRIYTQAKINYENELLCKKLVKVFHSNKK